MIHAIQWNNLWITLQYKERGHKSAKKINSNKSLVCKATWNMTWIKKQFQCTEAFPLLNCIQLRKFDLNILVNSTDCISRTFWNIWCGQLPLWPQILPMAFKIMRVFSYSGFIFGLWATFDLAWHLVKYDIWHNMIFDLIWHLTQM